MGLENVIQPEAELKVAEIKRDVAAQALELARRLKQPPVINVTALREAGLQMVFTEDGQIIFQERIG